MFTSKTAVTLAELIISIALLSVIVLAATTFDIGIRQSFKHSDIQAQLLTQLSPAMHHMTKSIMQGIGSVSRPGVYSDDPRRIKVRIDINATPEVCGDDRWIYYQNQGDEIRYCPNLGTGCSVPAGWGCTGQEEVVGRKIFYIPATSPPIFNFVDTNGDSLLNDQDNKVSINITACQDPNQGDVDGDGINDLCGSLKNPSVTLSTQISPRENSIN